ncbi:unnamed protein product [Rhizophagus irregularis]|nr:unnamed protein product [Rhizophagus irregularis]
MIQNRKNKNTEKGLASNNRNKMITNINKSSSNIQQTVEGTVTPIHERAQTTTNINKSSSNIQQAVEGTATPIHDVKERYKNLQLPVRYQTNEPTRDDDDASTENQRLSQEVSDLPRLREDNKFLAGVNAEFGSENDDLKEEVNELKTKLEQYQIQSSSESLDVIDVPEEQLAKRFKSDESKKVKKTIEMKMILKTIKPNDNLDDNKTFNSPKNVEIHSRLIPELRRAIFLNYKPLKKLCRIKAAKDLYRKSDERIIGYEKRQLLKMLANRSYHSPKISESDEENPDKTIVCVYDYSWRSQEYDDEVQHFDRMHPEDAPQWSYVKQEDFIYDMDIDSRSGFDEDEDYGEETEEVLINSQKSGAGDDLAE